MKRRSFIAALSAAAAALALPFKAKAVPRYIMAVDPCANPLFSGRLPDWHGVQMITWREDGTFTARTIPEREFFHPC